MGICRIATSCNHSSCSGHNCVGALMISTQEIGAGSYPDTPENDIKTFEIETEISAKMKIVVYAKTEEEAIEFAEEGKNDDINDIYDIKIENIEEIKEVNS